MSHHERVCLVVATMVTLLVGACTDSDQSQIVNRSEDVPVVQSGDAPKIKKVAAAGCSDDETIIYSCPMGDKVVAVCGSAQQVAYRFGKVSAPELELASDGRDDRAFVGMIVGGGAGGQQRSVRFANNGYDYVVYSADAGAIIAEEMEGPTSWSGLVVLKDGKVVHEKKCSVSGANQRLDFSSIELELPDDPKADGDDWGWF